MGFHSRAITISCGRVLIYSARPDNLWAPRHWAFGTCRAHVLKRRWSASDDSSRAVRHENVVNNALEGISMGTAAAGQLEVPHSVRCQAQRQTKETYVHEDQAIERGRSYAAVRAVDRHFERTHMHWMQEKENRGSKHPHK